jgi:hypothetical protein
VIAPSILSADFAELADEVERVSDEADLLHVDVMDGHFVPNLTIGPPVVKSLRKRTDLYLDCHLMVDNPDDLLDDFADAGADSCTVHIELGDPRPLFATMRDLGLRVGYVLKKDNDGWQQIVPNRPFEAYNIPVSVVDPGPDGNAATAADNGPNLALFNLDNPAGRPVTQLVTNIDDYEGTYKTFEFSSNKRYSNRWSMTASLSYTWTEEWNRTYFNNVFATPVNQFSLFGAHGTNPNEHTFNEFTSWNLKLLGTFDAGWGVRVTPVLKSQSGAPYGRVINIPGCTATVTTNCLNYGAQLYLVEPIGERRQDTVTVFDFRVEKQVPLRSRARLGLFFDLFNVLNSNTDLNINWRAGPSFEKATTVLAPRIAKFGVKFDW